MFYTVCDLLCVQGAKILKAGVEVTPEGPMAKKHAGDKKVAPEKKKLLKDKKRTLKRLWSVFKWGAKLLNILLI